MEILDQPVIEKSTEVKYAGFGPRFGASFTDGLILLPLTLSSYVLRILHFDSAEVIIVCMVLAMVYKPFMEYQYGATLGKKFLGIKVVNLQFENPGLAEVMMRNIFHLAGSFISLVSTIASFYVLRSYETDPSSPFGYSMPLLVMQGLNYLVVLVTIVDGIVLLADEKSRSLHDKIAKTYVVMR